MDLYAKPVDVHFTNGGCVVVYDDDTVSGVYAYEGNDVDELIDEFVDKGFTPCNGLCVCGWDEVEMYLEHIGISCD